jgi:hypothetical protein
MADCAYANFYKHICVSNIAKGTINPKLPNAVKRTKGQKQDMYILPKLNLIVNMYSLKFHSEFTGSHKNFSAKILNAA